MNYEKRKHNAPITTVIQDYLDKSGGKVSASRKEIKWRFYALDWRYQKQILLAFLASGMTDRKWAYGRLYAVWDDCFIPVIQGLWEKYHEQHAAWLIIRFFPIEYLKKEFQRLSEGRNYYFLYQRFANDKDFVLDRTRLNEADLLAVKCKLGETITDEDVKFFFFQIIYKLCKGVYQFRALNMSKSTEYDNQSLLTIFDNSIINNMIIVVNSALKRKYLVDEIREWMSQVTNSFYKENADLDEFYDPEREEYVREKIKEHCIRHVDPKYLDVWETLNLVK